MTTAKRIHVLYHHVSDDVRREMRFYDLADGVEVYTFDGLENGVETERFYSREEARAIWTAALSEGYVWHKSIVNLPPAPPHVVPAPAAPVKKPAPSFESEVCSRCLGSGRFSHCAMYGDTCFRCGGKGRTLTKRGEAAAKYLRTLRSKRLDEIQVSDVVHIRGGGPFPAKWETVDAEWLASMPGRGWKADSLWRVRQSKEQSLATWDAALAYQATLTKAGTPRRASHKAAEPLAA